MIYIYDILVNLNEEVINFYEWEKTDNIEHIKKIPCLKVSEKSFIEIYDNKVEIEEEYLNKIMNLTEKYDFKKKKYTCILSDGERAFVIDFLNNLRSRLMFEDEDEIVSMVKKLDEEDIKYKIIGKNISTSYLTRLEKKMQTYLLDEINNSRDNLEKLKYLYFEYYDRLSKSDNDCYQELIKDVSNNFNNSSIKLYKLLENRKKV